MSVTYIKQTYKTLCNERNDIIIEINDWILRSYTRQIPLWGDSYLEELRYIRQTIENEMVPHLIVMRMKFYKNLEQQKNIPEDIVLYIASFGDMIDTSSMYFISKNTEATIENIGYD